MLKIELHNCGVDDTLRETIRLLESAIESKHKKEKDALMNNALGAIETLYRIIDVEEIDLNTSDESSE